MLDLRPGDGRVLANLGLSYGAIREHQQSIAALEAAWQAYPHPRVRWMLADMYSAAGHPGRAATLLSQYLDEPFDWIAYAKHLLIAGRSDDARAALEEAERRSNRAGYISWPDLALGKADYLRSQGRYQEAELALRAGLDRGGPPGVERLELAMASLLVDAGRKRDAIAHLRKIKVELARNRIVRGVLAARAGDLPTADAVLQQLILDARERQAPRPEARLEQLRAEIALARHQPSSALHHAVRAARARLRAPGPW
jgi:tetratricopeptide (TPR) repeat protein